MKHSVSFQTIPIVSVKLIQSSYFWDQLFLVEDLRRPLLKFIVILNIYHQHETEQEPDDRELITAVRARVSAEEMRHSDDEGAGQLRTFDG